MWREKGWRTHAQYSVLMSDEGEMAGAQFSRWFWSNFGLIRDTSTVQEGYIGRICLWESCTGVTWREKGEMWVRLTCWGAANMASMIFQRKPVGINQYIQGKVIVHQRCYKTPRGMHLNEKLYCAKFGWVQCSTVYVRNVLILFRVVFPHCLEEVSLSPWRHGVWPAHAHDP